MAPDILSTEHRAHYQGSDEVIPMNSALGTTRHGRSCDPAAYVLFFLMQHRFAGA
jgi:hypothetical protein